MPSIFSKIISGEIPCYKIWEDEKTFAFLDIHPIQPGMTIVIPKKEIDNLFDLDNEDYQAVLATTKKLAPAIQKAMDAPRVGLVVEGFEIPHAHIKMIPIAKGSDLNQENAKDASQEELAEMAEKIKNNL